MPCVCRLDKPWDTVKAVRPKTLPAEPLKSLPKSLELLAGAGGAVLCRRAAGARRALRAAHGCGVPGF